MRQRGIMSGSMQSRIAGCYCAGFKFELLPPDRYSGLEEEEEVEQ